MAAHFGLDISSSSLKVAEATPVKNGYQLDAFGEVRTPISLQSNNPQDDAILVKAIKQLLTDSQIRSRNAYIALPETAVYTRVIQLPVLKEDELVNALKFESEQYIPVPLDEVYLEHQILFSPPKSSPEMKMDVLLVAAKKWMVDKIVKVAEMAEIAPLVIETAMLSTFRVLYPQIGENALLVDTGDTTTNVGIILHGALKQINTLPTAGKALTRAVAQQLSLQETQARQYKHAYGLENDLLEGKIAKTLQEPISVITNHIIKNLRFASTLVSDVQINQIVLSGGTSLLPNFTHYLVSQLDMEVNLANPLMNCLNTNLPQQLVSSAPRFSTVIGLAIRE